MAKVLTILDKRYEISLSPAELVTLFVLVGEVFGDPKNSLRKHTDSIYDSIRPLFGDRDIFSFGLELNCGFDTDSLLSEEFKELLDLVK